ncbi:MAG: transcription-repair coupling factor [Spirochaetota bacterium]
MNFKQVIQKASKELKNQNILELISQSRGRATHIEGIKPPLLGILINELQQQVAANLWVVFPTLDEARGTLSDLEVFGTHSLFYPSTGKQLYASLIDKTVNTIEQMQVFHSILEQDTSSVIVTTMRAFASPCLTQNSFEVSGVRFHSGQTLEPETIAEQLSAAGYDRVPKTTVPGEFSIRGEVIDIFPLEHDYPIRLFLDWDSVEKIVTFDPITQESVETFESVEFYLENSRHELEDISTIESYIRGTDRILYVGQMGLETSYESVVREAESEYALRYSEHPWIPRPRNIVLDFYSYMNQRQNDIYLDDIRGQDPDTIQFNMIGPRSFFGNFNYFREEVENLLEQNYSVVVMAGSHLQRERLEQMISDERVSTLSENLSAGCTLHNQKLVIICEQEIFGRRKKVRKAHYHYKTTPLDSFVDLNPGDIVVHVNYGIGRFLQIDRIQAAGKERDYIKLEYAQQDHVFIPIEQANLVQRYIGSEGRPPKLDVLGGKSWDSRKEKARKSAEDLAKMLIDLYAKRQNTRGFPFAKDTDWQLQFEASFPYEETEDQLQCIEDVKRDMESPTVMDRLICGDVGFGKTEVAIRALFKAVMSGKQVAFLAPTTILAEQHFQTINERLESFPLRVAMLSRFVDRSQQQDILKQLKANQLDVLVGTHRIIQKDVQFHDLGLLIVDEEQRFGVKDKERIKQLKSSVDSLALSATPIPRTLYMSLLKIRDMSLLTTPPFQRRPIVTMIEEFDESIITEAIRHEVKRGGQVFYLHNRVKTLPEIRIMLQKCAPEVSMDFAHGQMQAAEIEDKMRQFVHGNFQVLVSTTIIENGIDIPNVNTIIIDRADMYGISQLYQLRGRVGRSNREAYAYLLYPSRKALSEVALKRLRILSEHTDLGSGFKIAMKDMEIRGAGNLLGRQQHGQMSAVGLDMYLRILDEAIASMQQKDFVQEEEVFLDLDYSGFIPDSYITDPSIKFDIYKKIASISSQKQLMLLEAELEDRFGHMPEDMTNLLYIAEMRILCKRLSIYNLREHNGVVRAEFSKVADVPIDRLLELIRESSGEITIDQNKPNVLMLKTGAVSLKDKSLFLLEKLQRLLA